MSNNDTTMTTIGNTVVENINTYIVGSDPTVYNVEYDPPSQVSSFSSLPRFSHSDDISLLFSSEPSENEDYALGLIFVATFIISFFVVWGMFLALFKCLGPKFVGVFAGYPYEREGCKSHSGRALLLLSSLSMIICATLIVTHGLTELQYTRDTIVATNNDVISIHDESILIIDNIVDVSRRATPIQSELVKFLQSDVCPLNPGSQTETQIRAMSDEVLVGLQQLDGFVDSSLLDMDAALQQIQHATSQISQATNDLHFTGAQATAIMLPYFVIPAFVMVAVCMGWYDVFSEGYYTFMTWVILPLMVLLTIFAFLGAGWTVLAVQGNADFCSPTPESTIQSILNQYNIESGTFYRDVITFYTQQCNGEGGDAEVTVNNPWTFMQSYNDALSSARRSIDDFSSQLTDVTPEQLSQQCGVEYTRILDLLTSMLVHVAILSDSSTRSLNLYKCSNIVPLYTNVVYNATCQYSIVGATWIFASLLCMSFFGMICIMFRGAYYPIDYYYYYNGNGQDNKSLYGTSDDEDDDDDLEDDLEDDDDDDIHVIDGDDTTAGGGEGIESVANDTNHRQREQLGNTSFLDRESFIDDSMADMDAYTDPSVSVDPPSTAPVAEQPVSGGGTKQKNNRTQSTSPTAATKKKQQQQQQGNKKHRSSSHHHRR